MESEQIAVTETTSEASEPSSAEAPAGRASRYLKRQVVSERDPDLLCTLSMRTLPAWMLDVLRHLGLYVADAHKNNLGFSLTALGSIRSMLGKCNGAASKELLGIRNWRSLLPIVLASPKSGASPLHGLFSSWPGTSSAI